MKLRVAALAPGVGLLFANPGLTRIAPIRSEQLRFAPGTVGTRSPCLIRSGSGVRLTLATRRLC